MRRISTREELPRDARHVVFVHIEAHPLSAQMSSVMLLLAEEFTGKIEFHSLPLPAEKGAAALDIQAWPEVQSLPCVLLFSNGDFCGKVEGANPSLVVSKVGELAEDKLTSQPSDHAEIVLAIARRHPVVLFQYGPPKSPSDPDSQMAVAGLSRIGCIFEPHEVEKDSKLEMTLLNLSGGQPLPHLYVEGRFVGGWSTFSALLTPAGGSSSNVLQPYLTQDPKQRIKGLVESRKFMIFIKGTTAHPYCKFTKQLFAIFRDEEITDYGEFNVFEDDEVRELLKEMYAWPTYPQLYYKGKLFGGLDSVKAYVAERGPGSLKKAFE